MYARFQFIKNKFSINEYYYFNKLNNPAVVHIRISVSYNFCLFFNHIILHIFLILYILFYKYYKMLYLIKKK